MAVRRREYSGVLHFFGAITTDIENYVRSGELSAEKKYSAVRFRGQALRSRLSGAGYHLSEFPLLRSQSFDHLGISQETLDTVHLFYWACSG